MRTRRPAPSVLVIAIALLAAACGGGKSKTATTSTSSSAPTTTSSLPSPTTLPAPTTTTIPLPAAAAIAVWPAFESNTRFHDPVAAARSFATSYVHMVEPVVGTFRAGDARSGEITLQPGSRGPVTTVLLRQLGNDGTWWVLGSATPDIRLAEPAALAAIGSPVRLRGTSTAFEATVNVSIRQDAGAKALADSYVMGGANGQMGPFDATMKFTASASKYGAIVLYTISPETGHVSEATVIRVGFIP